MEPTPLEQQIGDLDVAIDRLRSLYDQYFMGIERIEPAVPRKDVERKIYALRKEQIRNTALRFRFQMILQRYSTFQSHWQRICREIENGTYKRQLRHSERRRPPTAETLPELVAASEPENHPPIVPSAEPTSPGLGEASRVPAAPLAGAPAIAATAATAAPPLRAPLPPVTAPPLRAPLSPPTAPPLRAPLLPPTASPPRVPLPAPGAALPRDLAAELEELDKDFAPPSPRGVGAPIPPRIPAIASTRQAQPPTAPRQSLPAPTLSRPPPLSPPARATAPGQAQAPSGPATTLPPARAPRVTAPPSSPKVTPAAATSPPRRDGGLPEYRVRQLYVEYIDAKRRQKESTASLTYEALATSLRASSQKLREKHGKPVDFEVGLKDGKAVLRPKLK